VFAIAGEILKPKSFAGLFGAAPSIALATVAMTVKEQGAAYASLEARSMILGAVAFFVYASLVSWLMMKKKWAALPTTGLALLLWFGVALELWFGLIG
jgi:lipoprotein signal peptidase